MKKFKYIFLIVGLVFFAFLVYEVGPANILDSLEKVGWRFLIIFALWFVYYVFQNFAWAIEMRGAYRDVGFLSLLRARIAGEAMNALIPLGNFGGEPVKAYLIGDKAGRTEVAASLVLDKTIFGFGSLIYIFLGLVVAVFALGVFDWKYKLLMFAILTLMIWGLIWFVKRRTFFTSLFERLQKWGIAAKFIEKKMDKIIKMDDRIATFYRKDKKRFLVSLALHFTAKMLTAVEFYIVFMYLGFNLTFSHALCINSLAIIINAIFLFVPGHWGVAEGAQAFIFLALGLPPADGIATGVIRRVRHIFWTLVGLTIFYFSDPQTQKKAIEEADKRDEGIEENNYEIR